MLILWSEMCVEKKHNRGNIKPPLLYIQNTFSMSLVKVAHILMLTDFLSLYTSIGNKNQSSSNRSVRFHGFIMGKQY